MRLGRMHGVQEVRWVACSDTCGSWECMACMKRNRSHARIHVAWWNTWRAYNSMGHMPRYIWLERMHSLHEARWITYPDICGWREWMACMQLDWLGYMQLERIHDMHEARWATCQHICGLRKYMECMKFNAFHARIHMAWEKVWRAWNSIAYLIRNMGFEGIHDVHIAR